MLLLLVKLLREQSWNGSAVPRSTCGAGETPILVAYVSMDHAAWTVDCLPIVRDHCLSQLTGTLPRL